MFTDEMSDVELKPRRKEMGVGVPATRVATTPSAVDKRSEIFKMKLSVYPVREWHFMDFFQTLAFFVQNDGRRVPRLSAGVTSWGGKAI
jgi:hypothetical protein